MESIIFFISVFLAGVLSFFSPCIFPLLPVYAGVLLDDQEQSKTFRFLGKDVAWSGLIRTLCFIAGISLIFFILGFGAGFLGNLLYADWFRYVMGGIIIILGISFSFGWTPCIGPVLSSILALAASGGNGALQGALLTLIYTLGMALPFLVLALASGLIMPYFSRIKSHLLLLKRIGGLLIILMGILLMLGQLNVLSGILG